jgi:hypothetical protein
MSNIFKNNSRFAALAEDVSLSKENKKTKKIVEPKIVEHEIVKNEERNSFKDEGNTFKRNYDRPQRNFDDRGGGRNYYTNRYSKEQHEKIIKEEKLREEEQQRIKAENLVKSMAPENFPTLVVEKKENTQQKNYISFAEKIKTAVIKPKKDESEEDIEFKNLKPGWAISKFDPVSRKIITKYKESNEPKPREKTENEYAYDALNALCDLHERRTAEYIETWGYDTWEKMFRSPTWDYEYFDRLDQEYEEAMEKLENDNNSEEEQTTEYNNYWNHY